VRVGVVVAGPAVPAWQSACVRALQALDDVTVEVAVADGAAAFARGLAGRLAGPAVARTPAAARVSRAANARAACDVVLDLTGTATAASATEGVWSFRVGEDGDVRQPFVREIGRGSNTVDVELVRRIDGRAELIRRGRFSVARRYASTLRWSLFEAARWPALFVARLRDGQPVDVTALPARHARRPLAFVDQVRFAVRLPFLFAGFFYEQLLEVTEWNVGLIAGEPRLVLEPGPLEIRWLPQPARWTFIADPFLVERDGRRVLFVEQFEADRDRGVIEALELNADDEVIQRKTIIDLPGHLSYPYPLEIDGALYLVPEGSALNEVATFRCLEFPWHWERGPVLFPAFDALDTTLFEHDGQWWALCTRVSRGPTLALHAYCAATPTGPWREHPLNPIVVDVTCARPAGQPFRVDGVLYRPGQSSADSYGCGLAISRIDELTPQTYRETVVRRLDLGGHGRYADGTHTLSFAGDTIAIDGKHVCTDVRKLGWAFSRLTKRLRRIGRVRAKPSPA
jgi:hypothetical protein